MSKPGRPKGEDRRAQPEGRALRQPALQTAPSTAFSAGWLQQREPFDAVAREAAAACMRLQARLAALRPEAAQPWRVIDLACGTGANLRWLAPRLGGAQQWLVVDHDATLLRRWPAHLAAAAQASGGGLALAAQPRRARHDALHFSGAGFDAAIVRLQLDLAQRLEQLPWSSAHLVTASALLDLVSAAWLQRLVAHGAAAGVAWLFALSVDGRHRWTPRDPQDDAVGALFQAHQQRDKGFGPALGARAAPLLMRALRDAGYRVHGQRSDWRLDGRSSAAALALLRAMVDGMAAAAAEQDPAAAAPVQAWRQRRLALAARGSLRVGHVDLLALPPR
jgi:SAM-dependent methyltransferase